MKQGITKSEYVQIVGLLTLAERHRESLREIGAAIQVLTGEADAGAHCLDAVYQDAPAVSGANQLLAKLGIAVP
jgi:hypothetical protein